MTESTSLDEMLKAHKQELDLLSSKNVEKWDDLLTYEEEPKNEPTGV